MGEYEVPEKTESRHERVVGLVIATIAVVLAIVSSSGRSTQNEQILSHVDASDQYAFYQAKKERSAALQLQIDALRVGQDRLSPAGQKQSGQLLGGYAADEARLAGEMKDIQAQGDELMRDALRLGRKGRILDLGEICLQISIVLCSITILTEQRLFVVMGAITAAVGILVALWGAWTG